MGKAKYGVSHFLGLGLSFTVARANLGRVEQLFEFYFCVACVLAQKAKCCMGRINNRLFRVTELLHWQTQLFGFCLVCRFVCGGKRQCAVVGRVTLFPVNADAPPLPILQMFCELCRADVPQGSG